jgi:3,4-dihydroxy 2-butanone 4-phosphate synthase
MNKFQKALNTLQNGGFVLIYDADGREEETDLVIASEFVTPVAIKTMRIDAGGLICSTVHESIRKKLGIPYLYELFSLNIDKYPILRELAPYDIPYDTKSSFAISINHRKTFTGITDNDRALTIKEFANFVKNVINNLTKENAMKKFGELFRSPGHVILLNASDLNHRNGHTELSTALVIMAGLTPSATICEMMYHNGYSRPKSESMKYAEQYGLVFLEGYEIIKEWERWRK